MSSSSPPVPVGVDSKGQSVPGEVPQLFGGNMVEYLKATGSETPLIVSSCIRAIDKEGEILQCVVCVSSYGKLAVDLAPTSH